MEISLITNGQGYAEITIPFSPEWPEDSEIIFTISYTSNIGMYYEKDYAFTHQTYYIVTSDHSATVNKNGATVNVEISLFEGYSNLPIPDISITMNLTSTNNNWLNSLTYSSDPILTNTDGKGVFNIKFPDRGDKSYSAATVNIKFMIQYKGITKEKTVSIEQGGNSPFIYSEDQHGDLHFEHEPISLKLIKAVEGSSYGTLRLLDQEGVYYPMKKGHLPY